MQHNVVIREATKSFGNRQVLGPLSLDVSQNEVVAVIGPSGAGKTTLLRLIAGLEKPENGIVEVNGRVGMVFQHCHLWPHKTVLENVSEALLNEMPGEDARTVSLKLLEKLGLSALANAFPESLSGGEAQRVAIARTLALKPDLLLLDEVTSALDPENAAQVIEAVKALASEQERSMIVVTHDLQLAKHLADRVVLLDQGKIVEQGHPRKILLYPETERAKIFVNSQGD